MPKLVRTPEEVLRKTRRNLYLIKFTDAGLHRTPEEISGRAELLRWFARNCPRVELEDLGPSETSGIIIGGIGTLMRVGFDKQSLAKYVAAWENPDASSKDPRWKCYCYAYRTYRKNAARIRKIRNEYLAAL